MSNSEDILKVMLQARTELVMTYLDYVELLSKQLLSQTTTPKRPVTVVLTSETVK